MSGKNADTRSQTATDTRAPINVKKADAAKKPTFSLSLRKFFGHLLQSLNRGKPVTEKQKQKAKEQKAKEQKARDEARLAAETPKKQQEKEAAVDKKAARDTLLHRFEEKIKIFAKKHPILFRIMLTTAALVVGVAVGSAVVFSGGIAAPLIAAFGGGVLGQVLSVAVIAAMTSVAEAGLVAAGVGIKKLAKFISDKIKSYRQSSTVNVAMSNSTSQVNSSMQAKAPVPAIKIRSLKKSEKERLENGQVVLMAINDVDVNILQTGKFSRSAADRLRAMAKERKATDDTFKYIAAVSPRASN